MRASPCSAFALFRAISSSHLRLHRCLSIPISTLRPNSIIKFRRFSSLPTCRIEQLANESTSSTSEPESSDFSTLREIEVFDFDKCSAATDLKHLSTPDLEVKDLSELPEQWRRARLAWLCKELPAHKAGTLVRMLNGQKKWMKQDDATYVVVHCMRIRENETGFRGCLEEACAIYNQMIKLGGYQPRLSLHNSLFRALVSKPGVLSKHYLKQAESIYHNLVTTGLDIHKDIYGGLMWLHSYQDTIDKERITALREEMLQAGIEEGRGVLLSVLRASARKGDVEEAEKAWLRLNQSESGTPSLAFVHLMEVYSKVGKPMNSLEIFMKMQEQLGATSVAAYNKIIEILCKCYVTEQAESIMGDFLLSGLKPLIPSYVNLLNMYFKLNLHANLELVFYQCLEKCCPNHAIYSIYLDSLVKVGNLEKAENIFNQMVSDIAIGVNGRSCNIILSGYLSSGNHVKAEKIYDLMCRKKV